MKCTIFAMTLAAIVVAAARGDERRPTGATTQPARWVIEARIVETAATTRPATQPATTTQPAGTVLIGAFEWPEDAEPLFRPDAKPLASIEVLATANEPFSATATVAGQNVRLAGRARPLKQDDYISVKLDFEQRDARVAFGNVSQIKTNVMLTIGKPIMIGGFVGAERPYSIAVRLTPEPQQEK